MINYIEIFAIFNHVFFYPGPRYDHFDERAGQPILNQFIFFIKFELQKIYGIILKHFHQISNLYLAVLNGNIDIVRLLLKQPNIDINMKSINK